MKSEVFDERLDNETDPRISQNVPTTGDKE
jgi:hypothetical protein